MFPRRTVFVLGAGASCDLGLPSGDQLREALTELLTPKEGERGLRNTAINRAIFQMAQRDMGNEYTNALDAYFDAANQIRYGLPLAISIDNYLHAHREDSRVRDIGKLAISVAILEKERASSLNIYAKLPVAGVDRYLIGDKLQASWYMPLMRLLTAGRSVNDLASLFDNVAFVVFNYDRCLEHFLVNSIMTYFDASPQQAISCVSRLTIIHPYGRVGNLPWQGGTGIARFGGHDCDFLTISNGIQTFTESADEGVISDAKNLMREAETLVFMGYGFLDQNNAMLTTTDTSARRVFATTDGISDSDVPIIKEKISHMIGKREPNGILQVNNHRFAAIYIERGRCRALMDNHRFRLAQELPDLID